MSIMTITAKHAAVYDHLWDVHKRKTTPKGHGGRHGKPRTIREVRPITFQPWLRHTFPDVGDRVVILTGPFKDFVGEVVQMDPSDGIPFLVRIQGDINGVIVPPNNIGASIHRWYTPSELTL